MSGVRAAAAEVAEAERVLSEGGLALMPTDTVYGLCAALDSSDGRDALYALKGRDPAQPCQVLIYSPDVLTTLVEPLGDGLRAAVDALLPGQVTCIVPDPWNRCDAAAGDNPGTVGLRAPAVSGALLNFETILMATSANEPGGPDPRLLEEVPFRIAAGVGYELDAGPLPGVASAVVDLRPLADAGPARLVRTGPDPEAVAETLAEVSVRLAPAG